MLLLQERFIYFKDFYTFLPEFPINLYFLVTSYEYLIILYWITIVYMFVLLYFLGSLMHLYVFSSRMYHLNTFKFQNVVINIPAFESYFVWSFTLNKVKQVWHHMTDLSSSALHLHRWRAEIRWSVWSKPAAGRCKQPTAPACKKETGITFTSIRNSQTLIRAHFNKTK